MSASGDPSTAASAASADAPAVGVSAGGESPVASATLSGASLVGLNNRPPRPSNESRGEDAEIDRRLVVSAQKGDMSAFRQLVVRHQRRAFAVAMAMVRDENDAHELVQDAFLRAYKGLATFQGDSSFYTWFYRIVKNLAVDLLRRPGRQTVEFSEEPHHANDALATDGSFPSAISGGDPDAIVRRKEMSEQLRVALEGLSPQHREVILMRELEGASYDEIADVLRISKGTVMSRLFYARQKLQCALRDFYRHEVGDGGEAHSEVATRGGGVP